MELVRRPLHRHCPICGSEALEKRWEVKGYTITRCGGCAVVFVQDIISGDELAEIYAPKHEVYSEDNREQLEYYYRELGNRIVARVPQPGRIFDVGCSGGWFLELMQGWDCFGCEISQTYARIAQQRFGDRIFEGSIEDYPLREDYFDVITMQDVFDHCQDPLKVLEKCHRMLKADGLLIIKVHNISCLYAKLSGSNFYAIIPPYHLFYYDPQTLAFTTKKAGFRVVKTDFIAHLLCLSTVLIRLARGDTKSVFYRLHSALAGSRLGNLRIKKNLNDIMTVFAVKESLNAERL